MSEITETLVEEAHRVKILDKQKRLEILEQQLSIEKVDTLRFLITQVVLDEDKSGEYRNLFDKEDEITIKAKIMRLIKGF